jgi:hypothetical protein
MIKLCTCEHKGQDRLHGRGMRVFNECKGQAGRADDGERKALRCTVCGKMLAR